MLKCQKTTSTNKIKQTQRDLPWFMIFLILSEFFDSNWVSAVRGLWTWAYLAMGYDSPCPKRSPHEHGRCEKNVWPFPPWYLVSGDDCRVTAESLQSHCRVSVEQSPALFLFLSPSASFLWHANGVAILVRPPSLVLSPRSVGDVLQGAKHLHEVKHERDHQPVSHVQVYSYIPCLAPHNHFCKEHHRPHLLSIVRYTFTTFMTFMTRSEQDIPGTLLRSWKDTRRITAHPLGAGRQNENSGHDSHDLTDTHTMLH